MMEAINAEVLTAQLGFIEAIGCALMAGVFGVIYRYQDKKRDREREADLKYRREREDAEAKRQERDKAIYGVVLTTARGTELLLHQAHGEKLNGNVEQALNSMNKAISKYNELANENMAEL